MADDIPAAPPVPPPIVPADQAESIVAQYIPNPKVPPGRHSRMVAQRNYTLAQGFKSHELRPWHKRLALWYVSHVKHPTAAQALIEARRLTQSPLQLASFRNLLANPTWKAYCQTLADDMAAQGRLIMEQRMVRAVETHFDAIDKLYEAGEYKDIFRGTNPILDRAWPLQEEGSKMQANVINITVYGNQTPLNQPVEMVEIQEVEAEEEPNG